MPWFKVDDQLDGNKKVKAIPRRNRAKAIGLWTMAGAFCARELTDGFVPDYMLEELASTPKIAEELVRVGMWERVENGWKFVHWSEFQPTSDEVRSKRAREAQRKARQRENALSRKQKRADQVIMENVPGGQHAESHRESHWESHRESALPDPTRPDPSLSMVTVSKQATSSTAREQWAAAQNIPTELHAAANRALLAGHPEQAILIASHQWQTRQGHKTPGLLAPLIRDAEATLEAEAEKQHKHTQAQTRRAAITNCNMCDQNGYILGLDDAVRCRHDHTANDTLIRQLELDNQPQTTKGPF